MRSIKMKDRVYIFVNPIRLHPKSGGGEYTRQVLQNIILTYNYVYSICPAGYNVEIPSVHKYKFLTFNGMGSLFLELNISYLYSLLRVISKIKHNPQTDMKIILNSIFGSISTYILSKLLNAESIYIAHNVEVERYNTKSVFNNEILVLPILKLIVPVFEYFATKFDKIISISHADKRKLVQIYNVHPEKIIVIPPRVSEYSVNPVQKKVKSRNKSKKKIIIAVYHGTYYYLPNKEAMNLIKQDISKKVKYDINFVVFGSGSPKIEEDTFKSVGFVRDIYEFLSSCDIAIVPLKRGAGVKLKILDYMAVGLPIVTTKKGAEGLELANGKHAIIVDDVNEEFIRAIEYLIENPKMRRKLGHNAKKLFEKKYLNN